METLEINEKLNLMEKYKLTAEEIMLIELLFLASIEEGHKEYLYKYLSLPTNKTDLRELLLSLQDKGVILKSYKVPNKGCSFDPESIEFNNNFLNNYRKYSGELGYEFFKEYPSYGLINGREVPLRNFAKKFNNEFDFFFAYGRAVKWKLENHNHVLELLRWAKENQCRLLNMNIADFVISKTWLSIEDYKNGDSGVMFDNLTTI